MEDLFCVASGACMLALDLLESAGVPLVRAGVQRLTPDIRLQLALVFLLSNLLPALILTPALGWCAALLERAHPRGARPEAPGSAALPDAAGARRSGHRDPAPARRSSRDCSACLSVGMQRRRGVGGRRACSPSRRSSSWDSPSSASQRSWLAGGRLSEAQAGRIQALRGALSTIRHLEDALADVYRGAPTPRRRSGRDSGGARRQDGARRPAAPGDSAPQIDSRPTPVAALIERTRKRGPLLGKLRATLDAARAALPEDERLHVAALLNDVEVAVWMVHRLAKILVTLVEPSH